MSNTLPAEEIYREKNQRQREELAELAPHSMAAHAALFHKTDRGDPVIPARHHAEWVKFAHDFENYRWVVVVCPPGYAKSTWWSIIYPSWRIGVAKGRIRIGLISNTAHLTWGFSRSIMRVIADPLYRAVYEVGPDDKNRGWSQQQFWVDAAIDNKNPTVMSSGIGGPIQGMRFDEIICDDLSTWEDVRSDTVMDGQRHFIKSVLMKRYDPGGGPPNGFGRCIVATTRWGERDLVPLFESLGFKIITMPALGYWDRKEGPDGSVEWGEEPLWPMVESKEELESQREEDEVIFELVKQGNPKVVGGDVFDVSQINRHEDVDVTDPDFLATFTDIVQSIDTAGGKDRKKGDFFVDATIGVRPGEDGREEVWILDIERGRYPAPVQEKMVIQKGELWNPQLILIEERNEGGALFQRLIETTRLPVKAWYPEKDKEFRAIQFANALNSGKVHVPAYAKWVRPFEVEAAAFPRGPHDDQIDAVSAGYNHTGSGGPRLRVLQSPGASAGLSRSQRRFA